MFLDRTHSTWFDKDVQFMGSPICFVDKCIFIVFSISRDSKTEFIVFRSPQLKCDLSGLSVNVGESMITQSSKVRALGVIFDQFLNFDDNITAICRSTHVHISNIGTIRNLLSYDACSTIIHALISC